MKKLAHLEDSMYVFCNSIIRSCQDPILPISTIVESIIQLDPLLEGVKLTRPPPHPYLSYLTQLDIPPRA